jgi:hypothetical protein
MIDLLDQVHADGPENSFNNRLDDDTSANNGATDNGRPASEHDQNGKNGSRITKLTRERKTPNSTISPSGQPSSQILQCEDWFAFLTIDGLVKKAGVGEQGLPQLIIKELTDNGLDASPDTTVNLKDGWVAVQDAGPGIPGTDDDVAALYSISRPQRSSKFYRKPSRGCMGHGTRVVAGSVVASNGELYVSTRGRRLRINIDRVTGESRAERVGSYVAPGTRVELRLGRRLAPEPSDLLASEIAITFARKREKPYGGKTSPHWYSDESFHVLMRCMPPNVRIRAAVANLEGCTTSASAARIAEGFDRREARSLSPEESSEVLRRAKGESREVTPARLGRSRPDTFPGV